MSLNTVYAIFIWLSLLTAIYYAIDRQINPNTTRRIGNAETVTLKRDPSGHYQAEIYINGYKTSALVDTGATGVAVSTRLAKQINLQSRHAIETQTANGNITAYATRLDEVRLGGIVAHDVAATIVPNLEGNALLGMSFLARMDIRLNEGTMTIRQTHPF